MTTWHLDSPSRTTKDLLPLEAAQLVLAARTSLDEAAAMTSGWTRRQLLDVALTLAVAGEGLSENGWGTQELRRAHAAWNRGLRSEWAAAGERVYHRVRRGTP